MLQIIIKIFEIDGTIDLAVNNQSEDFHQICRLCDQTYSTDLKKLRVVARSRDLSA